MVSNDTEKLLLGDQKEDKIEIDCLKLKTCSFNNDIYTLYWASLNNEIWDRYNNNENNQKLNLSLTNSNRWAVKGNFFFFIVVVLFILSLIIYQVFSSEINVYCPIQITVLRILLVLLVQFNLFGEFREGLVKWKYASEHEHKFIEPFTAKLIGFFQFLVALASYITLLLFICTEDTPLSMIMDFTGIVVFVELDDWIGSNICSTEPSISDEKLKYAGDKINEKLTLNMKLSLIQYYTDVVENTNAGGLISCLLMLFTKYRYVLIILPFSVLGIEILFKRYHPYVVKPY